MDNDEMIKKLRNSSLYNLAVKRRITENNIPILYQSKNFMVVDDDFLNTLLKGYEILNKAHKNGIEI